MREYLSTKKALLADDIFKTSKAVETSFSRDYDYLFELLRHER